MIVRREPGMSITDHYLCLFPTRTRNLDECHAAAERFAALVGIAPTDYAIERRPNSTTGEVLLMVREGADVDSEKWRRVWASGEWMNESSKRQ